MTKNATKSKITIYTSNIYIERIYKRKDGYVKNYSFLKKFMTQPYASTVIE